MTAIAGFWSLDRSADCFGCCERMLAAQELYGPHDLRIWTDDGLSLGRRLYRRLPQDQYDRSVHESRDGRFVLAADLRLDNRDELASDLSITDQAARMMCDAGLLLHALERWEDAAVERLVGEFAFALWDRSGRTLRLARDFLGRRPLHFHRGKGFVAVSSMVKGLHALPQVPYEPDEQAMAEFLALLPQSGPRSFFKSIDRVEPGHVVTLTPEAVTVRRFWNPKRPTGRRMRLADCIEGLRFHLDRAVKSQLRGAERLVGSHLSGGLDSGIVTATAARLLAPEHGNVVAFTNAPREGYAGPAPRNQFADESQLAAETAALYPNVENVVVRRDRDFETSLLDRRYFADETPLFGLSVWALHQGLNRAARARRIEVMLSGTMGNFTLSYDGAPLLSELLRQGRLLSLLRYGAAVRRNSNVSLRGLLVQIFGPFIPDAPWSALNRWFLGHAQDVLDYTPLRPEALKRFRLDEIARERKLDFAYRPWADSFDMRVWGLQRTDVGAANKGMLGTWGIDLRDPTADRRLVEYCLSIPTEHYLCDGIDRGLARRAFADRLPPAVVNERRKGYPAADWHEFASAGREELVAELERIAACAPARDLLDVERLQALVKDWPADDAWARPDIRAHYRLALLRGIAAGHFLRKAVGGNR